MTNIIYGIFAEDSANDIFIGNAIPQLVAHLGLENEIFFDHNKDFTEVMIAKNGKYVVDHFTKHVLAGIKNFGLELCFVGLDADDADFVTTYNKMTKKLGRNKLEGFALIFIPVQSIEYWLWYLKEKMGGTARIKKYGYCR